MRSRFVRVRHKENRLSELSQQEKDEAGTAAGPGPVKKPQMRMRSIHTCNFRSAGRLSNENARALSAIHETFARSLADAMDAYLGTGVEVKLLTLDQLPLKEHVAGIPPLTYIVPFSLSTMPGTMVVECDIDLVFPIIELLLGGTGMSKNSPRDLSEIEEEIMHDVTALIARQAEHAWHVPNMSLVANRRIKSSILHQYCPPNEKVTVVRFEIDVAGATGSVQLVFPTLFLNVLINKTKVEQPQKRGSMRFFPKPSMRERILNCDVMLSTGLPHLKVPVRDLIALQPGTVLKLRAPVRAPGMLDVSGLELFEALPVRNGTQKAAQLGRRMQTMQWEKE